VDPLRATRAIVSDAFNVKDIGEVTEVAAMSRWCIHVQTYISICVYVLTYIQYAHDMCTCLHKLELLTVRLTRIHIHVFIYVFVYIQVNIHTYVYFKYI